MGFMTYFKNTPDSARDGAARGGTTTTTTTKTAGDAAVQLPLRTVPPFPPRRQRGHSQQPSYEALEYWRTKLPIGPPGEASINSSRPASVRQPWEPSPTPSIMTTEDDTRYHVALGYVYHEQQRLLWIHDHSGELEGVMIRRSRNDYIFSPPALRTSSLARAMASLNAAMTINCAIIKPLFRDMRAHESRFSHTMGIQILADVDDLARASKHQYAAFIASKGILVVWDDDQHRLQDRANSVMTDLVNYVWDGGSDGLVGVDEKEVGLAEEEVDVEAARDVSTERPIVYYHSFMIACTICIVMVLLGTGYQNIYLDIRALDKWISLAFLVMTPINAFLGLFFAWVMVTVVAQIVGPMSYLRKNSKYYSANRPARIMDCELPHVTIQCPVYKEGLAAVIAPTIRSVKQAISTYELQGGTANIFINDDGIRYVSEEEKQARVSFYEDNGIGWTARPQDGEGFVRKGRFKKASNMNYSLRLSNNIEQRLLRIERPKDQWTQANEAEAYNRCLFEELEEDGMAWADGNIRVGDYLLIIDSDTRIPSDCLLDAVSEMEQSPDVAILQFSSSVMQVSHSYFENGIAFFTNLVYQAIRFGVSSGDVAPFVGHNALLRWSAVQEVSFTDEDGHVNFWSEAHVSEDFDLALRLQIWGYVVRLAAWAGDGFQEGVSLTVYDEITRWEKYAYGCDELVFHPLLTWPWKGPFTPLFRSFLTAGAIPIGSRIGILAYIGTYYALGAAWIITTVNYVFVGLYNGYLDKFYIQSWQIWVGIIVVFSAGANLALAVQRYRLGQRSFFHALKENFVWALLLLVFFGGISMHISQALLCHLFGVPMVWEATSKEVEFAHFFTEMPKVARKFRYSTAYSLFMLVVIVVMAWAPFIPWSWNIDIFIAVFPVALLCACHLLVPVALNPALMTFYW